MSKLSDLIKLEKSIPFTSTFDHRQFRDKIVIFTTTHHYLSYIKKTMSCLFDVLNARSDTYLVVIDNASDSDILAYLRTLRHSRLDLNLLSVNQGRAVAQNSYLSHYINTGNQPRILFSIDPDITFSVDDFDKLIRASLNLPRIGMLSMRYKNNRCNPESRLKNRPRIMVGLDKNYAISIPTFSNVAGGIFAIRGDIVFNQLKGRLFPKKSFEVYANDDAALHDALRRRFFINGYLEGTEAIHYRSGETFIDA